MLRKILRVMGCVAALGLASAAVPQASAMTAQSLAPSADVIQVRGGHGGHGGHAGHGHAGHHGGWHGGWHRGGFHRFHGGGYFHHHRRFYGGYYGYGGPGCHWVRTWHGPRRVCGWHHRHWHYRRW